tara:strand:- start:1288 stop:2307 length:1020 start_codon:yes stop_codon:yes gene_type:complete
MIFDILKLIVTILKLIYCTVIAIFTYLYDFDSSLMRKVLENFNIYGSIENLDKYYDFKKKHNNGVALFTHTSYLDGIILAAELQETPSFVCVKEPLISILYDIAKKWKCLIIEPNQNNSKIITETILERNKNDPLLLIAPTGTNLEQKNEFELNEFKTGPFISLSPVLPILISYNPHIYVEDNSLQIKNLIDIINIEKLNYKVKILDPIYPDKDDNIDSYKNKVYNIMNSEREKIEVDNIEIIETQISKKIFIISIILIIISIFIFSDNKYIILSILFILTFIIIILRNKNSLFNYLYKNLIYIYSGCITIYSSINANYLLFINSLIYPFLYNILSKIY